MLLRKKSVAAMKVNNDCWSDFVRKARARPLEPLFVAAASAGFKGQPFGPIQQRHSPVTGSQQASCKARSGAPRDAGQAARVPSTANKRTTSLPTVSPRVPVATVVLAAASTRWSGRLSKELPGSARGSMLPERGAVRSMRRCRAPHV